LCRKSPIGLHGAWPPWFRWAQTYRTTQIVSGSFVLNSLLLREVNILGNLLVIALITTEEAPGPRPVVYTNGEDLK